jgi:hypothetical protein
MEKSGAFPGHRRRRGSRSLLRLRRDLGLCLDRTAACRKPQRVCPWWLVRVEDNLRSWQRLVEGARQILLCQPRPEEQRRLAGEAQQPREHNRKHPLLPREPPWNP